MGDILSEYRDFLRLEMHYSKHFVGALKSHKAHLREKSSFISLLLDGMGPALNIRRIQRPVKIDCIASY